MIHHPTHLKCIDCYSTAPQTDLPVFEVAMRYTWPSPRIFVWKFEQAPTTKVLGLKGGEENVGSSCILAKMCKGRVSRPSCNSFEVSMRSWLRLSTRLMLDVCALLLQFEILWNPPQESIEDIEEIKYPNLLYDRQPCKWYPPGRDKRNEAGVTRIKKAGMHRSVPTATGCNGR